ncbi:MAG: apolipoprotein N-acyltransferase [Desulfobacterales bacterium]|jgi:apolipoprotein N-acyltransferase
MSIALHLIGAFLWALKRMTSDRKNMLLAALSGLLLTGSFPKIGLDWLAWVALVPLLAAIANLSAKKSFRIGFVAGLIHYLSLLYWVVPVMRTYGYLPYYLSIAVLFLFAAALALFPAVFSLAAAAVCRTPARCLIAMPLVWVTMEYIRTYIFTGFPWALLGHSQYLRLHLIQITDLFGVYGLSFLIVMGNMALFLVLTRITRQTWQNRPVSKRLPAVAVIIFVVSFLFTWTYGSWRIKTTDQLIAASPSARVAVIQGNVDQAVKWNPAFQDATIKTHNRLSLAAKSENPDLIVWPESATPFYLFYNKEPTSKVLDGIQQIGIDFLIGSPSFTGKEGAFEYYNSAYLISPQSKTVVKYDKAHLVPYGEYVPFKKWLPFLGKMVAQVGDFRPGKAGKTLPWKQDALGIQICYEIIFPGLSRAMVKNDAVLLINITNDAWFGTTSGPYQHFSISVLRAVENRRALARAANTGISGFIDPAGRILASTSLLQEAALTRTLPLIRKKTVYTRFGDLFALACLAGTIFGILLEFGKYASRKKNR